MVETLLTSSVKFVSFLAMELTSARTDTIHPLFLRETMAEAILIVFLDLIKGSMVEEGHSMVLAEVLGQMLVIPIHQGCFSRKPDVFK